MHWYVLVIVIDFINIKKNWNLSKKFTMVRSLGSSFEKKKQIFVPHLSCKWHHVTTGIFFIWGWNIWGQMIFLTGWSTESRFLIERVFSFSGILYTCFLQIWANAPSKNASCFNFPLLWHILVLKCADLSPCQLMSVRNIKEVLNFSTLKMRLSDCEFN